MFPMLPPKMTLKMIAGIELNDDENYLLLAALTTVAIDILKKSGMPNCAESRTALKITAKLMEKAGNVTEEDIRNEVKFYLNEMKMEKL